MILYGPPGSGKTTLARIVAPRPHAALEELSAVQAGRAEVRKVLERAQHRRGGGADGLLPRRDPPLQQGPAGRAAARGRGGPSPSSAPRRRTPTSRSTGAALALRRSTSSRPLQAIDLEVARAPAPRGAPGRGRRRPVIASWPRAPRRRAHGARRPRARCRDRTAAVTLDAARGRRCSAGADLRQDRRPPLRHDLGWIKACAARTPTPRSTAWRCMLEGGEDPRSSCGACRLRLRGHRQRRPGALEVAVAAAAGHRDVACPRSSYALAQAAISSAGPQSDAATKARSPLRARTWGEARAPAAVCRARLQRGGALGRGIGSTTPTTSRPPLDQELAARGRGGERFYGPDDAEAALRERLEEIRRARGR